MPENENIPVEVLDLIRFMCETWVKNEEFVYKHCTGEALMHHPVVQGTGNQIALKRIAEQPYDRRNIRKGVDWMLQIYPLEEGG